MTEFKFKDKEDGADDLPEKDADGNLDRDGSDGDGLDDFPEFDESPGDDAEEEPDDGDEDGVEVVWTGEESQQVVPTPGCAVSFFLDNKRHHALCLAVIGDELLLEHKGASRCLLFIGKVTEIVPRVRRGVVSATITVGRLKQCRYRSVPKRWLQEMVRTGQSWKGVEGAGKLAPSPGELLNGQMELF